MRAKAPRSANRSGLCHAPQMLDLQAEAVKAPDEFDGRRRATTNDTDGRVKLPFARTFFKSVENGDPHGWDAAGDGDLF